MPLTANEEALLGNPSQDDIDEQHQTLEYSPSATNKIGRWTIVALILNRTIGSGIFLTPHRVLAGTGCVGGALLLWLLGAIISICGLYVWLECAMSIPQRTVRGETEPRGVPRSGGEKNFLEFMFPNPKYRTTCTFAVMFILLYNLTGNAVSLAIEVMIASGSYDPLSGSTHPLSRSQAVGIAVGTLTFVILLHIFSRRGGILLNNAFAVAKVALLGAIIFLGIAKALGAFGGFEKAAKENFTDQVFHPEQRDPASWSNSLMLCMYTFSGYEQPFYVLAETKSPRKNFPKYTLLAMVIVTVLFMLVNIAYLFAVPKTSVIPYKQNTPDLATLFFESLFDDTTSARRAMAALIAISIFGNLVVMTFTASRVKQEIAKEGILPYSLTFATSYITLYGLYQRWKSRNKIPKQDLEHAPSAAFLLHWGTSVLLILVTLGISDPRKTYAALISLYSYTIISLLGAWVSIGLILTKLRKGRFHWSERSKSPYHKIYTGITWYIVPAIGLSAPLWGLLYYAGLCFYQRKKEQELVVIRTPFWMQDPDCPGEYVQKAEIIDHAWLRTPRAGLGADSGFEMNGGAVIDARGRSDSESSHGEENRQVQIRVHAASINPIDVKKASGMMKLAMYDEFPYKIGFDCAGIVSEVGNGVKKFKVGDEVYVRLPETSRGSWAEYAKCQEYYVAPKPKPLSFGDAASLPLAAMTALQAMRLYKGSLEGKTVFVPAGLSGTGAYACQLAKNIFRAGKVITTVSTSKVPKVPELLGEGVVDQIIDYTKESATASIPRASVDFLLDTTGQSMQFLSLMVPSTSSIVSISTLPSGTQLQESPLMQRPDKPPMPWWAYTVDTSATMPADQPRDFTANKEQVFSLRINPHCNTLATKPNFKWEYFSHAPASFTDKNAPDLSGKAFIVTGATSDVGELLASILYSKNAKVCLAAHSADKAEKTIHDIKTEHPASKGQLVFLQLDPNGFTVKKVMVPPQGSKTAQGYQQQLGTNDLAPFLFTKFLTPLLKETAKTEPVGSVRVVWVASSAAANLAPKGGVVSGNILQAAKYVSRFGSDNILNVSLDPGKLEDSTSRKAKSEGGNGIAEQFYDWDEKQIAPYA
ncbi:hypothetical protein DV737_g1875, partial [Chaetothyriales sp. CBS 132003]